MSGYGLFGSQSPPSRTEQIVSAGWANPNMGILNTPLPSDQEGLFRAWLQKNKVPFQPDAPVTDYDMRGFWSALTAGDPLAKSAVDPNDNRLHYPDYWKTPLHTTFSNESKFATPQAPRWVGDTLVSANGQILFDDRARKK